MAQSFEDECFSDGDLDLLASHTINELENEVLQSTQQKKAEDQDTRREGLQFRGRVTSENLARESFPRDVGAEASSDYGLDDEDIIDLDLNQYAFSDLPQDPKAGLATRYGRDKDIHKSTSAVEQRQPSVSGTRQSVSLASRPAQHASDIATASKAYPDKIHQKPQRTSDAVEKSGAVATSKVAAPDLQSRVLEVCSYIA